MLLRLIFLSLMFLSHAFDSVRPLPIPPQLSGIGSIHRITAVTTHMFRTIGFSGRTVRFVMIRTSVTF